MTCSDPAADRPSWYDYFMELARATAARAACTRRKVGVVLASSDRRIISTGYNGAPSGHPHCTAGACPRGASAPGAVVPLSSYDDPYSPGFCVAVHAEANALLQAGPAARGAVAYITDRPCPGCMKLLIAAGVSTAVWPGATLLLQQPDVWDDWKRTDPDRRRCPGCGAHVTNDDFADHVGYEPHRAVCEPCAAVARTESSAPTA